MNRIERELEAKGYRASRTFSTPTDAKEYAKKMRKAGYRARVVKSSTRAIGYHDFTVWIKPKERE